MYGCQRAEQLGHIALSPFLGRVPSQPVDSPYIRNRNPYFKNRNPYFKNRNPYIRNRGKMQPIGIKRKNPNFSG